MRDERGSVTAFVAVFAVALVAVAGLVFDGGMLIAARRRALNEAEAAARAAAQAVSIDALRSGHGVVIDEVEAERRARAQLGEAAADAVVEVHGDVVTVRFSFEQSLAILSAFGLPQQTIEGEGRARAVRGVREGEP